MDFILRCNSLKCRAQLADRAVVTTCSHIFCSRCSDQLGLSNPAGGHRTCPACATTLNNPDDAVSTQLNPTEDYKTSVLSGLNPSTIMECAGRGLAFWSYQSTQEIVYQEFLARSLTEKYGNLSIQMDKIINDANAEIENLNQRLGHMQVDQDKLKTENANILAALREKAKKHQQTQELYDRLKRKEMTAVTQSAAFDSADEILQAAAGRQSGPPHPRGNQAFNQYSMNQPATDSHQRHIRNGSGASGGGNGAYDGMMAPPPPCPGQLFTAHNDRSQVDIGVTPQHRTRLGSAATPFPASQIHGSVRPIHAYGSGLHPQTPSLRRPLASVSRNLPGRSGFGGAFGLSAGMRKGTPQGPHLAGFEPAYEP